MANIKRCRVIDCEHGDGTCCQYCDIELDNEGKCTEYCKIECYKPDPNGVFHPSGCLSFNKKNKDCLKCGRKPYLNQY